MDLIKQEMDNEFKALGFKNQRKSLTTLDQVGKTTVSRDKKREALAPGKRISKNGKIYWEQRRNRSDVPGTKL